jgi:hypothetical protein
LTATRAPHRQLLADLFEGEIGSLTDQRQQRTLCTAGGERLRPCCDLASELPVRRHRPTQRVAIDSPTPSLGADTPPSTVRIKRIRKALEQAIGMPSPNRIYKVSLLDFRDGFLPAAMSSMKATVVSSARGAIACRSRPNDGMTRRRSTTTRSRSFHNELCGRLERRKRQLVAFDASNPANELSHLRVIKALAQRETFAH